MAIERVKTKLDELLSGEKTPSSVKGLETELKNAEKEVQNLEKEYSDVITQINKKQVDIEWAKASGDTKKVSSSTTELSSLENQSLNIANSLENTRDKAEQLKTSLNEAKLNINSSAEVQELQNKLVLLNSKLSQTKEEANQVEKELNECFDSKVTKGLQLNFDTLGKKIDDFRKRITRLLLATFVFNVIRSGFSSLRNSLITLLKSNSQFSTSLNQIKANLMTAFAPIYNACLPAINTLMNALSKFTGTIAIFVANLFGTSITDATKQAKKLSSVLEDTADNADKASNSLGSFDDIDVLESDTSKTSQASSGSSGIDYSGELQYSQKLLDALNKFAKKLKEIWGWIKKNKELVILLGKVIIGAFAVSTLIKFLSKFTPLIKVLKTITGLFVKVGEDGTTSFNKAGIGVLSIIAGLVLVVRNIATLTTSWSELTTAQKLVRTGLIVLGTALMALGIYLVAAAAGITAMTAGMSVLLALGVTLVAGIAGVVVSFLSEKDAILSTKEAQEQLTEAQENYKNAQNDYINAVDSADTAFKNLTEVQKKNGLSGLELYEQVENGTLNYMDMNDAQKEVYKAYLDNLEAQDNLKTSTEALSEAKRAETIASYENELAIAKESGNYNDFKKSVVNAMKEGKLSTEDARDLMEKAMSDMSDDAQETFMEDIPNSIKDGIDPDKYKTKRQKLKDWFSETWDSIKETAKTFFTKTLPNLLIAGVETLLNKLIYGVEKILNTPINALNELIETANNIPLVNISKFNKITLGRVSIPRLATGTVIPPRQEFAAILGDQKHGTNIEAPLSTIEEAVAKQNAEQIKELASMLNNISESKQQDINIKFSGTLAQLVRILKPELDKESRRKGFKIVSGVS